MRIDTVKQNNLYTQNYAIKHNNPQKANNNSVQQNSQYMTQMPNYGYGQDLITRKNIAFKGSEIQKAVSTLLNQFPFEDRLASLLQHLKVGELVVTGKDFNTAQRALLKYLNDFDQVIRKEIFLPEKTFEHNYAFFKYNFDEVGLLNINDKKLKLISGGKDYQMDSGKNFFVVNNDTIQYGSDVLHLKMKPKHDISHLKASFSTVFDFGKEVQTDLNQLNKKTISKRILAAEAPATKINFSKIGGQDKAIDELKKGILYPIKFPNAYSEQDITRGYILHGPAGTGKTALCKALANEAGVHSEYVSGTAFQAKYVGESEANVRAFFDRLIENQPSIGIIDELDAVGVERGAGDQYGDKLIDQILTCMTDIYDNGDNVFILGLTNRYKDLDTALKRAERFSKHIRIGEPDKEGVKAIFNIHTAGRPLDKDVNTDKLVDEMYASKAVGGDIKYITKLAKEEMMKRLGIYEKMDNGTFTDKDLKNSTIKQEDFLNAIEEFKTQHRSTGRNPIGFNKK